VIFATDHNYLLLPLAWRSSFKSYVFGVILAGLYSSSKAQDLITNRECFVVCFSIGLSLVALSNVVLLFFDFCILNYSKSKINH